MSEKVLIFIHQRFQTGNRVVLLKTDILVVKKGTSVTTILKTKLIENRF